MTERWTPQEVVQLIYPQRKHVSSPNLAPSTHLDTNTLTATTRYIVNEVNRYITEQEAELGDIMDETQLNEFLNLVEQKEGEELSERERSSALNYLLQTRRQYGLLTPLFDNSDITDIIVRAYNDVSVQVGGKRNVKVDIQWPDHSSYKSFHEYLLKRAGKQCSTAAPVVDAALEPDVRVCATHESFSPPGTGPMLAIRICRHKNISLEKLCQSELAPQEILDYLAALVAHGDMSLLVAGEVGTGKTTLTRALAAKIPEDEALLIIEDTQEIVLDREFTRTLLTREANTEGAGKIAPAVAIRTAMRLAMNRIILGEMRDDEAAEAFIDVCSSGHTGMSTIHARSAKHAISRLELFLSRTQKGVSMETIRREIADAVDLIVFVGTDKQHKQRRIMEVVEVGAASDGSVQTNPIYLYNKHSLKPSWVRGQAISRFADVLRDTGVELSQTGEEIALDSATVYSSYQHG